MKKNVGIIGSTGSIGINLLKVIKKEKKKINIVFLSANKNYKKLINQAKFFKVKNLILTDKNAYNLLLKKKNNNFILYNNFESFEKIVKKKLDYVMSSITGLSGLYPTITIIKYTKKIAIANKESIICAWNLISNELDKHNTKFVPVDSEHFSIWFAINQTQINKIEKIYLTASGGPLINIANKKLDKIKKSKILKHPNWNMGKKISIDSSNLMNKVFEIIEAKNIFKIPYSKLSILIHPASYIHAIIKFKNGMIKIIAHKTTMKIPIGNTLFDNFEYKNNKLLDFNILNKLNFKKIDKKKFPLVKILDLLPNKISLFETLLVSADDYLVQLFLEDKINYTTIQKKILKIAINKKLNKYKKITPKSINDIINLDKTVRKMINNSIL